MYPYGESVSTGWCLLARPCNKGLVKELVELSLMRLWLISVLLWVFSFLILNTNISLTLSSFFFPPCIFILYTFLDCLIGIFLICFQLTCHTDGAGLKARHQMWTPAPVNHWKIYKYVLYFVLRVFKIIKLLIGKFNNLAYYDFWTGINYCVHIYILYYNVCTILW